MQVRTPPQLSIIESTFARFDEALRTISLKIHEYKELPFQERRSARLLSDFLETEGFHLERGVAGRPTAFVATYAQFEGITVSFNAVISSVCKAYGRNMMLFLTLVTVADITLLPYVRWALR